MTEFVEKVKEQLQEKLPDLDIHTWDILKNNDTKKIGIEFRSEDGKGGRVYYIDSIDTESFTPEEIAKQLLAMYQSDQSKSDDLIAWINDCYNNFSRASGYLRPQLINYDWNQELVQKYPCKRYWDDLAVILYLKCPTGNGRYTCKVTSKILEGWGVSFEDAYAIALHNLQQESPSVMTMDDVLAEAGYLKPEGMPPIPMTVLTNAEKNLGASVILQEGLLDWLYERYHSDIVLIPSSIHEWIVVPFDVLRDQPDDYSTLVKEVNDSHVLKEERLSDHVYIYRKTDVKAPNFG